MGCVCEWVSLGTVNSSFLAMKLWFSSELEETLQKRRDVHKNCDVEHMMPRKWMEDIFLVDERLVKYLPKWLVCFSVECTLQYL